MTPPPSNPIVCLITSPPESAEKLAEAIVQHGLAACVNVLGDVRSIYRWEGELRADREALLIAKTMPSALAALDELLTRTHPYETFELVVLDIADGSHPYLRWIAESVSPEGLTLRSAARK